MRGRLAARDRSRRAPAPFVRVGALVLGALLGAATLSADEPRGTDAILEGPFVVDVEATAKGIAAYVSDDLDALPAADRAEELLRRETFLQALRWTAAPDGTFRLGVAGRDERATRGTWKAVGEHAYALTIQVRFGVPVAAGAVRPVSARLEPGPQRPEARGSSRDTAPRLTYRDADGSVWVFRRAPAAPSAPLQPSHEASPAAPPAPSATPAPGSPAPARETAPGVHPAAYVGAWELDRDRMVEVALSLARRQLEALEPEQRKLAEALLDGDAARDRMRRQFEAMQIEIDLRADGTLEATLGLPGRDAETAAGTWEELEGKVVLVLTTKGGKPATKADRRPVNGRLDGGTLWLDMTAGRDAIPLRRSGR